MANDFPAFLDYQHDQDPDHPDPPDAQAVRLMNEILRRYHRTSTANQRKRASA